MSIFRPLISLFLILTFAIGTACGPASHGNGSTIPTASSAPTSADGGTILNPVDVVLQGLPDASSDGVSSEGGEVPVLLPMDGGAGPNGEVIVPLRQGIRSPFNGVLFNGPAIARIAVEFHAQGERCMIDRRHELNLAIARYDADVASLRLAIETQRRTDQVLVSGRDQEIARLNRIMEQQTRANNGPHIGEGLIWAGGGLLVGALLVGGIVFAATSSR